MAHFLTPTEHMLSHRGGFPVCTAGAILQENLAHLSALTPLQAEAKLVHDFSLSEEAVWVKRIL